MKRPAVVLLGVGLVVLAIGCTRRYETRVTKTIEQMKRQQKLDQYLEAPEEGLKDIAIYLREPKPLTKAAADPQMTPPEGTFEVASRYLDLSGGGKSAPASIIRGYVFARVKRGKKPPTKKGEASPPDIQRGDFIADVRGMLAGKFGSAEFQEGKLDAEKKGSNSFKRSIVRLQAGNDTVDVKSYFFAQDNYEVALIWEVPNSAKNLPTNVQGIELSLEALAVGNKALARFQGGDEDDTGAAAGEAAGQVF